jgi:WD40 repeat protein
VLVVKKCLNSMINVATSWVCSSELISVTLCRLWDVRSGKIAQTLETKASVTSAEVSPDGRFITTADGFSVKFWDANQ